MRNCRSTRYYLFLWLVWWLVLPAGLQAQAPTIDELDLEPPVIDHEALDNGTAGETQTFSARITDERGIESVLFHYRTAKSGAFDKTPMRAVAGTSQFVVSIDTERAQRVVEYFIEARDTGGNRVLKGLPVRPLVRPLITAPTSAPPPVATAPGQPPQRSWSSRNWWYIALGILAVGAIASQGGDSGGSATPALVPLTVTATQP